MSLNFNELDQWLTMYQLLWRNEPFHHSVNSSPIWQSSYPLLAEWVCQLTTEEIEFYKSDLNALHKQVSRLIPFELPQPDSMSVDTIDFAPLNLPRGIDSGIPGRKFAQIIAMSQAALKHHAGNQWLEWCSGKGYLGRILASQSQQRVVSFEFQSLLCQAGQNEADKLALPMQFVQGDAFSPDADRLFHTQQHAVALHACGDLHVTLMQKAAHFGLPALTLSPCCYHLIRHDEYQPLSAQGKASKLRLTRQDLRIPLQETVTGGERVKRHRFQEMVYRLGFDLLRRNTLNIQEYQPLPSIKKSMLAAGFKAFCLWGASHQQWALPESDWEKYQQQGEQRFWQMERLSLLQDLFRRPLELWLVMDRAEYLREQGYRATIHEFCERSVTPRNLLIHAERIK